MMGWLISILGAGIVAGVLRDIFHTLWHPSGHGTLTRLVMASVWRVSRPARGGGRVAALAGPLSMVAVVGLWGALIVLGWALVYWPHLPEAFVYASGLDPDRRAELLDAVYLSLVTVATLGFGDIVPATGWLRVATPLQALVGFALLTAAVSWVLQIYPALARRRALAIRLALLRDARSTITSLHDLDSPLPTALLDGLTTQIIDIRVDLAQYAETYYFHDRDPVASLAATLGYVLDLARDAGASTRADMRLAADLLTCALDGLGRLLDRQFLHTGGTTGEILRAFAADHGHSSLDDH